MNAFLKPWTHVLMMGACLLLTPAIAGQEHGTTAPVGASMWHSNDHSRLRLIQAGQSDDGLDQAGLQFDLDEGWHTYWRSPGRFGIPAAFRWEGSENIRHVEVRWPEPEYITSDGYEAYGYTDRVVLPLLISREDPAAPAVLHLAVDYAVCETVCIPATGFVSLILAALHEAETPDPSFEFLVQEALRLAPTTDVERAGIAIAPAPLVSRLDGARTIRISAWSETAWQSPRVIVEGPDDIFFGPAKVVLDGTSRHLVAFVPIAQTPSASGVIGPGFRVTITGGALSVDAPLELVVIGDPAP